MNRLPFWDKVQRGAPSQCWPWLGYVGPSGHGRTSYKCFSIITSRKAWILTYGPVSSDLCVLHKCDNALCCNPGHLYLGTRADNMIDRWSAASPNERGARLHRHVMTLAQIEELFQMRREGVLLVDCAKKFGVSVATVCRFVTARRREKLKQARLSAA